MIQEQELVKEIFRKVANVPTVVRKKNVQAKYISDWISDNFNKTQIHPKTIVKHYDMYMEDGNRKGGEKITKTEHLKFYSCFLGFKDYGEFLLSLQTHDTFQADPITNDKSDSSQKITSQSLNIENYTQHTEHVGQKIKEKKDTIIQGDQINNTGDHITNIGENKNKIGLMLALILFIAVVVILIFNYVQDYDQDKCIVWKDTKYQILNCEESGNLSNSISLNDSDWEKKYKDFKRINLTESTQLFDRSGNPLIWYTQIDGRFEFFNNPGSHPISGKSLNPLSQYLRDACLEGENEIDLSLFEVDESSGFSESDELFSKENPEFDYASDEKGKYCFINESKLPVSIKISSATGVKKNVVLSSQKQSCLQLPTGYYQYRAYSGKSMNAFKIGNFKINFGSEGYLSLKPESEVEYVQIRPSNGKIDTKPANDTPVKACVEGDLKIVNRTNLKLSIQISQGSPLLSFVKSFTVQPNKTGKMFDLKEGVYNLTITHGTNYLNQDQMSVSIRGCEITTETIE